MWRKAWLGVWIMLTISLYAQAIDFSPVTDPIGEYIAGKPSISGAGLLLVKFDGTVLLEQYWGEFDRTTVVPIASATKWFSGTAIMSLVDDGLLDLDQPVGQILPAFAGRPDGMDQMTVRQMLSHTSGLPGGSPWVSVKTITLKQAVNGIAATAGMNSPPGTEFRYGGTSMQVAGRVAEVAAQASWEQLFADRVTTPLGISDTDFLGLGPTTNPRIAGGAQTSVDSYERVLRMLVDGGIYNGQQILSPAAVATMLSDQTAGAVIDSAPSTLDEYLGYGIGTWIGRLDDADMPVEFISPGAFGTTPWIDFENEYYGLFMIGDSNQNVDPLMDDLRAFTRAFLSTSADFDNDGDVDGADFLKWQRGETPGLGNAEELALWEEQYGSTVPEVAATAVVPEPGTTALLLTLIGTFLMRRQHPTSQKIKGVTKSKVSRVNGINLSVTSVWTTAKHCCYSIACMRKSRASCVVELFSSFTRNRKAPPCAVSRM